MLLSISPSPVGGTSLCMTSGPNGIKNNPNTSTKRNNHMLGLQRGIAKSSTEI
ncbi:hypothetical protein BOH78_3305 [Pichia kudriavzevii]|uniref:Uncharacterized protein n=1 Tax=Pichia kudriavzevii TaxID=4909 RepID=A0A099NKW7_PICKU|nr:hypothetical protein JL09_g6827 [Pichia kudriavzevii]KGK32567.1 hypothetical protein JL09_g6826 [Pichia kudriavzevii]ONH73154.1 hypothetical protein BOH78_3305 [Pichia kudriavzevii]